MGKDNIQSPASPLCNFRKPPATEVGLRADRGCTNIFFTILFLLFWGLMGYVAFVAYQLGDLDRLRYGVDYLGHTCSKDNPDVVYHESDPAPWRERVNLWYPLTFTPEEGFIVSRALKLGVCVKSCPNVSDSIFSPNVVVPYTDANSNVSYPPYRVLFNSRLQFNRCVPNIVDFECGQLPSGWQDKCRSARNSTSIGATTVYGLLEDGFNELAYNWWVILSCAGIAVVVCFIWLFCLRRLVKPMVVISLLMILAIGAAVAYLLILKSQRLKETAPQDDTHKWYFYGAIAMGVVIFLYLCVVAFLFRDIMLACDIIEEASKIPIKIPTMVLVPPVLVLFMIPFVIFGLFTAAHIYTAAKTINHELPIPNFDFNPTNTSANGNQTLIQMREYTFENWRVYAHLYNLFMFLWTVGFIHAIGYMTFAFCAVFWYWSNPGDDKQPQAGPCKAAGLTLRYHLGTLALGSMIIAIIQVLRVIMRILEDRMQQVSKKVDVARVLVRCAECCLACFERVVKFVNKNAYVITAMTGESFLPAARHGTNLLLGNVLSVGAVSIISEYVMVMGKIIITAGVVGCGYGILQRAERDDGFSNGLLVLVVIGVFAYFIACVFIHVLSACIDTVLLSYCYDLEQGNGADKPHYFPSDLRKHVDGAAERLSEHKRRKQKEAAGDIEVPLRH